MDSNGRPAPRDRASLAVAGCALAGVSLIAAVVSYLHALAVVRAVGARPPVAWLVPFLADLVILGASAGLLHSARRNERLPRLAVISLAAGIGVTLAMNVAAGWSHGPGGRLVAGWPAVAFILALESLAGIVRRGRGGAFPESPGAAPVTPGHPEPPTTEAALAALLGTASQRALAGALGVPRSRVTAWAARVAPAAEVEGPGDPATASNQAGFVNQRAGLNGDAAHG